MTQITWHGDAIIKEAKKKAWQRVLAAGAYLKSEIQKNVSIPTEAAGRTSRPGEYPHIGYHPGYPGGTLRREIFVRKREDMIAVDVGTKLVYGVHWELTNRPYIRRTYAERLSQIKAILEGRMTRTIEDVKTDAAEMRERHQTQKEIILGRKKAAREAKQAKKTERRAAMKAKEQVKRSRQQRRKK